MRCRGVTDSDSAAMPSIPGKTAMRSGTCRGIAGSAARCRPGRCRRRGDADDADDPCAPRALERVRQNGPGRVRPGPRRASAWSCSPRAAPRTPCARPACPSPTWPTSPASPRCWTAASRPCIPASTAACWPCGGTPTTSASSPPRGSPPLTWWPSISILSRRPWRTRIGPWQTSSSRSTSAARRCSAPPPRTSRAWRCWRTPADYPAVLAELRRTGGIALAGHPPATRAQSLRPHRPLRRRHRRLLRAARAGDDPDPIRPSLSALDSRLSALGSRLAFPALLHLRLEKIQELRYGENPHQRAAFYRDLALRGRSGRGPAAPGQGALLQQPARPPLRLGAGGRIPGARWRPSSSTTIPAAWPPRPRSATPTAAPARPTRSRPSARSSA